MLKSIHYSKDTRLTSLERSMMRIGLSDEHKIRWSDHFDNPLEELAKAHQRLVHLGYIVHDRQFPELFHFVEKVNFLSKL